MTTPVHACRARRLAAAALFGVIASAAVAGQFVPFYDAAPQGLSRLLPYADGGSPYSGVGRYEGQALCTAFFLVTALPGQDHLSGAPAYALTAGRCAAALGPHDVLIDQPGVGTVTFNYFADSTQRQIVVPVAKTAYATMKGRDLAVLELAILYQDLVGQLVRPWLVPRWPRTEPGDLIAIVGAPSRAVRSEAFLRLASCRIEGVAPILIEHTWHWFDAQFDRCRDIGPGSAGSPVISIIDRYVVAMVSVTTPDGNSPAKCEVGHPCEPAGGGTRTRRNTNYATLLAGITACLDERHRFSVNQPGCPLEPARQLTVTPSAIDP